MDNTLSQTSDTPAPNTVATRRLIDAPVRAFHWLIVLCFAVAWLTGDGEELRYVHITAGYTMLGLIAFRIVYGLAGPRQARLATFRSRVAGLPAWLGKRLRGESANGRQGVNLAAGAVLLMMIAWLVLAGASGVATHFELTGDWMEEVHEFFANTLLVLVIAHLVLIAIISRQRKQNMALSMITGRTPGTGPDIARRNHGLIAAVLLATVLGFWGWSAMNAPTEAEVAAMSSGDNNQDEDDDDD